MAEKLTERVSLSGHLVFLARKGKKKRKEKKRDENRGRDKVCFQERERERGRRGAGSTVACVLFSCTVFVFLRDSPLGFSIIPYGAVFTSFALVNK